MGELTTQVGMAALKNPDEVGAAALDYLMYSGYIILAYLWLRMALVAQAQLDDGSGDAEYCQASWRPASSTSSACCRARPPIGRRWRQGASA
ncbi:acyl-CoA dehydrogenase C-terminal domain-containing protein [Pseudomonas sp. PCH446]